MLRKVLAVSAATQRVGYVYFANGRIVDWGLSLKSSKTPDLAATYMSKLIRVLEPDAVVTEKVPANSRKGDNTVEVIKAMAHVAIKSPARHIAVPRRQRHRNKYEEAESHVRRFPEVFDLLPARPRLWESEPRKMAYFEAISLGLEVIDHSNPRS